MWCDFPDDYYTDIDKIYIDIIDTTYKFHATHYTTTRYRNYKTRYIHSFYVANYNSPLKTSYNKIPQAVSSIQPATIDIIHYWPCNLSDYEF